MENKPSPTAAPLSDPCLGFHYFPDTLHYREADLKKWVPELQSMGASWLVLRSEVGRAIPEMFLRGLKQAGIQPVIQFQLSFDGMPLIKEAGTLIEVYGRWGARHVVLFDRPNMRSAWPQASWVQQDLVERFLDRYLPLANLALSSGLAPVFPPLEPGGSYWDTAFLRSALQVIVRRKQEELLQSLVLSAYAWTGAHALDWGAGGPAAWPQSRPYQASQTGQDQRGFHIFDWYAAIARDVLHRDVPILLFQAGLPGHASNLPELALQAPGHVENCKAITRLMGGEPAPDPLLPEKTLAPVSAKILACNFWHLGEVCGEPGSSLVEPPQGPAAELAQWLRERRRQQGLVSRGLKSAGQEDDRSIRHYLLLPGSEWGISDWYLEIIRPFVKKHLPTVGFSVDEALKADLVTVVGNLKNYPEDLLARLEKAGCMIDQINGDGTKIASELAER